MDAGEYLGRTLRKTLLRRDDGVCFILEHQSRAAFERLGQPASWDCGPFRLGRGHPLRAPHLLKSVSDY
jgi:hypothetical protein